MAKTFKVEIITPYRVFLSEMAESVVVTSVDGEIEILADHEPTVTPIAIGAAKILVSGSRKTAYFSDGFLEMEDNKLTILVGAAEWPEEIDVERAERALKRATERLEDKTFVWETTRATLAQKRAQTRLRIASLAIKTGS
jgi:F-type H+-transporting ATPase subunit epsilon